MSESRRNVAIRLLAAICIAATAFACVAIKASNAQQVGETIMLGGGCTNQLVVEQMVERVLAEKHLSATAPIANAAVARGECGQFPRPTPAEITSLGIAREPFVDEDGDTIIVRAVQVNGRFWTIYWDVLEKS